MSITVYWASGSCPSWRVLLACEHKGLAYESIPTHLLRGGGEQHRPEYRAINPLGLVPALDDEGTLITQSLAIVEYLDETHPSPPLLPGTPRDRAAIRSLAYAVADTAVIAKSPLTKPLRKPKATWVEPSFAAEVDYRDITSEGLLRQSSFRGLTKMD